MTSIVFNCDISEETIAALIELRQLRRDVLYSQAKHMDQTMAQLEARGGLDSSEDILVDQIEQEIRGKIAVIEDRLKTPDVIYEDELAMYLSLISG